jgi:hypothetical protein
MGLRARAPPVSSSASEVRLHTSHSRHCAHIRRSGQHDHSLQPWDPAPYLRVPLARSTMPVPASWVRASTSRPRRSGRGSSSRSLLGHQLPRSDSS